MVVGFCGWVVIRWWILISLDLLHVAWINLSQNKKIRSPRQPDEKGGVMSKRESKRESEGWCQNANRTVQTPYRYPRLD